jgi:excisionase family DNA binding protein
VRVKWYKTRKRWRVIVPARFTGTGKKQFILFKSKLEGEAEIRRILNRGNSSSPQISEGDEAAITLAKGYGMSPEQGLETLRKAVSKNAGATAMSEPLFPLHTTASLTLAEVAERTGIHIDTLRKKCKAGLIPGAFQAGGGGWRFKRIASEDWWASLGENRPRRR